MARLDLLAAEIDTRKESQMQLLESVRNAFLDKETRQQATRKRYVDLLKQATYRPEKVTAKDQAEFKEACDCLGISLEDAMRDMESLREVQKWEGQFALHRGHGERRKNAEAAIQSHVDEARTIRQALEDKHRWLQAEWSRVMDRYAGAQRAAKELETLKKSLGDLASHVDCTLTE
jgi:hypothetical protein